MKLPTISFSDKTTPVYQPSIIFPAYLDRATDNNNHSPRITVKLKDRSDQVANALAYEMRKPLGNINLSVELLESLIADDDLKIYLDVIKRNSIRIDNLLCRFLPERIPDDGTQTENISIH